MRPISAIFFDLGGTLFSYRSLGVSSGALVERLARLAGHAGDDLERVGQLYYRSSGEAFRLYAERPYYLHREVFHEAFRRFAVGLDREPTQAFLEAAHEEMQRWMVSSFTLREECEDVLARLRSAGFYLSIVSNIDDGFLQPMIERSGLSSLLDDWSSSEEARSCKPDRRFFEYALAKAACPAGEVLFVGDSPEHDIAGARPLGMRTALIVEDGISAPGLTGEVEASLTRPDHTIRRLDELIPIASGER